MLAIEPPRVGHTYLWLVEDLMARRSSDVDQGTRGDSWPDRWARELNAKRGDPQYDAVVESIRDHGFIRPLDATTNFWDDDDATASMVRLADGHHRLAAALDLGHEAVPVFVNDRPTVAPDSGGWGAGHPVSTQAGVSYRDRPGSSAYSGIIGSW